MHRLKKNQAPFQVVSGPMARQRFKHGREYREVPPGYADRFEPVTKDRPEAEPVPEKPKRKNGDKK